MNLEIINRSKDANDATEKLLKALAKDLNITKTQYDNLVKSYRAVGKWLEDDEYFSKYYPVVSAQGSLRLGTIIQPTHKDDDLDVDLVFRLRGKTLEWTQKHIKEMVGKRLRDNKVYNGMLDEEGRRCWTLLYRQQSQDASEKYHMDILPCVANQDFDDSMRRMIHRAYNRSDVEKVAIRITDNEAYNYSWSTDEKMWLKSNPDAYAVWFASRCKTTSELRESIMDTIMPLDGYTEEKSTLQRSIQILKRHRDIMFKGDNDKPISIIITTLASRAYKGQKGLLESLVCIINNMSNYIEMDGEGNYIVTNPVNEDENFADKWIEHPKRKENFFKWMNAVKLDFNKLLNLKGIELRNSVDSMFGEELSKAVFTRLTPSKSSLSNSALRVSATGIIGTIG